MILRLSPKSSIYLLSKHLIHGLKGQNCKRVFFPYISLQFCVSEHGKLSLLSSLSFQPENMKLFSLCPSLSFKKQSVREYDCYWPSQKALTAQLAVITWRLGPLLTCTCYAPLLFSCDAVSNNSFVDVAFFRH